MKILPEHFAFLDELQKSGVTNMLGAGPYVQDEFGLGEQDAKTIHLAWMSTFDGTSSVEERVELANSSID